MTNVYLNAVLGLICGLSLLPIIGLIIHWFSVEVKDETAVILSSFGKLKRTIREPGLHFWLAKILPWSKAYAVSLKRDFRQYEQIHVNDCQGTTIIIDLWIEFSIRSPEKALFQVENWEKSLQSILTCSATSILGSLEFSKILSNRSELGKTLKDDIKMEISRWGLEIDLVFISKLSVLPEVSQQLFDAVAARLEKAKADIEEAGRLESQLLEAETQADVAALEAEAKGQYSLSIGKAYSKLASNQEVLAAYQELYELSIMKPQRTIAFQGFSSHELTAIEASMVMANKEDNLRENYALGFAQQKQTYLP